MRVLVVEDNPDMGPYLKRGLMEHGFAVDLATDGNEGLRHAATGVYDLLILDRMLPGRDGLDILRHCAVADGGTPAIFLTAKALWMTGLPGSIPSRTTTSIKPFSFAELLARSGSSCGVGPAAAGDLARR